MYYKIRDDIELRELEKYGFYDIGICYKAYLSNCQYLIDKGTKMIKRIST